ncbi:hypothetical protein [Adhaeribacter terrigena]|nr:hypothetical protein [Adhaeribacter terrigena]
MESYFPLTKKDDYYTFKAYLPTINKSAIAAGSVVGGLAGGLVAHALTANHEEVDFAINMITGKPVRIQDYNPQADINKAAKIFVYRKASKQAREKLSLYVNDSLYAEIFPLTYQELNFKYPVSEVKICLNGTDQHCLKITPSTADAKYLEVSLGKKPGSKPEILIIPEKVGKYYLNIVKRHQDKPKK